MCWKILVQSQDFEAPQSKDIESGCLDATLLQVRFRFIFKKIELSINDMHLLKA